MPGLNEKSSRIYYSPSFAGVNICPCRPRIDGEDSSFVSLLPLHNLRPATPSSPPPPPLYYLSSSFIAGVIPAAIIHGRVKLFALLREREREREWSLRRENRRPRLVAAWPAAGEEGFGRLIVAIVRFVLLCRLPRGTRPTMDISRFMPGLRIAGLIVAHRRGENRCLTIR